MGKKVGIVAAAIVGLITILLILEIWGVIHIDLFIYLKSFATWLILLGAGLMFLIIYGMFFWKGNTMSMREKRELEKKNQNQGGNSNRASDN